MEPLIEGYLGIVELLSLVIPFIYNLERDIFRGFFFISIVIMYKIFYF